MSQFDFGNLSSPLSGSDFINNKLEPWRDALHSSHKGTSAPSYVVGGLVWVDSTTNPWVLRINDGASNVALGTINTSTHAFAVTGLGTLGAQAANSVTIAGGTIDATVIGGTTKAAGGFTTITGTGNATIGGTLGVTGGLSAASIDSTPIGGTIKAAGGFTTLATSGAVSFATTLGVTGITTLTGGGTSLTPSSSDSSTKIATTEFITRSTRGGFINKFRNPVMFVSQRGITGGTVSNGYTLDGWQVVTTGASVSWSQQALAFNNALYALNITGATSNTDITVQQRIEAVDIISLLGQQVTFQCTITNNSGASITPTIKTAYPTAQDNWAGNTVDISTTNLQAVANGSQVIVSYTFQLSASAFTGYQVIIDIGALNSNAKNVLIGSFDLRVTSGVTTGLNANPPPLEVEPIALEFVRNKRFIEGFGETLGIVGIAYATSTTAFGVYIPFKNKMRAAPTGITVTTVADLEIVTMAGSNVAALTGLSFGNASEDGIFLTGTVASGLTSGTTYQLKVNTALAGNVIFTGVEL